MKKIISAVFLIYFSNCDAKQMQDFSTALKPLFACEEAIIKDNPYLTDYKSELWPLITDDCGKQLKAVEQACGMQPNQNADACADIINEKLDRHYRKFTNKEVEDD